MNSIVLILVIFIGLYALLIQSSSSTGEQKEGYRRLWARYWAPRWWGWNGWGRHHRSRWMNWHANGYDEPPLHYSHGHYW